MLQQATAAAAASVAGDGRTRAMAALPDAPTGAAEGNGSSRTTGVGRAAAPKPKALSAPAPSASPVEMRDLVTFDVGGGTNVKFPLHLIQAKPETVLGKLLAGAEKNSPVLQRGIYVDAVPDRFTCILDWYRYGEIFVPRAASVQAVLRDCRHFGLPDLVIVNGVRRGTRCDTAFKVNRNLVKGVVEKWTGFAAFFDGVLEGIRKHYAEVSDTSGSSAHGAAEEAYDFPPYVLAIYDVEKGWLEPKHAGGVSRARVLAIKLEERGYLCYFTETELVVQVPSKLRGEMDAGGVPEEEMVDEEIEAENDGQGEGVGYSK